MTLAIICDEIKCGLNGVCTYLGTGDQKEVKMEILKNLGHFVQDVQTEIC